MNYTLAVFRDDNRREIWRTYVANSMWYQAEGKRLLKRYDEIINKPVDNRSVEDIVADVIKRAGLVEVKDEHI